MVAWPVAVHSVTRGLSHYNAQCFINYSLHGGNCSLRHTVVQGFSGYSGRSFVCNGSLRLHCIWNFMFAGWTIFWSPCLVQDVQELLSNRWRITGTARLIHLILWSVLEWRCQILMVAAGLCSTHSHKINVSTCLQVMLRRTLHI